MNLFLYFSTYIINSMLDRRWSIVMMPTQMHKNGLSLQKIGYVRWHFSYLGIVKLFDVTQCCLVLIGDKIDGDTFAAESTTPTDAEKGSKEIDICIVSFMSNIQKYTYR